MGNALRGIDDIQKSEGNVLRISCKRFGGDGTSLFSGLGSSRACAKVAKDRDTARRDHLFCGFMSCREHGADTAAYRGIGARAEGRGAGPVIIEPVTAQIQGD